MSDEFDVADGNFVSSDIFPIWVRCEVLLKDSVSLGDSVQDCLDLFGSRLGRPPCFEDASCTQIFVGIEDEVGSPTLFEGFAVVAMLNGEGS